MRSRRLYLLPTLLAGCLLAWWLWPQPVAAPSLQLGTIDGRRVELAGLTGGPVLVSFWSTSCAPCIAEMPFLQQLYDRYRGQGFELISIIMPYDRPDLVLDMVRHKGITYPVALDLDGSAMEAFEVRATPSNFLLDPAGRIQLRLTGKLDQAQLQQRIETMLRGQS